MEPDPLETFLDEMQQIADSMSDGQRFYFIDREQWAKAYERYMTFVPEISQVRTI